MFEHLVGKLFKKSERAHSEQFHASGKSINEKVRLYVRVGCRFSLLNRLTKTQVIDFITLIPSNN